MKTFCKCGCGQEIAWNRTYVQHHNIHSITHRKFTDEEKLKLGLAHRGIKCKKATKIKISLAQKGRKFTDEHRQKLSVAYKTHPHPCLNKKKTQKTKDNIRKGVLRNKELMYKLKNQKMSISHINILKKMRQSQIFPIKDTSIELKIQSYLNNMGIAFQPHKYMHIPHAYQCDIFIPSKNLIIECDGDYWHDYPNRTEVDNIRTQELQDAGFKVLRLWEREITRLSLEQFRRRI